MLNIAYATEAAGQASGLAGFLPLVMVFVVLYFFMIRPQAKKQKEHQAMVKTLKKGDEIVTSSGIFGTIKKALENEEVIEVEVADNVVFKMLRSNIAEIRK